MIESEVEVLVGPGLWVKERFAYLYLSSNYANSRSCNLKRRIRTVDKFTGIRKVRGQGIITLSPEEREKRRLRNERQKLLKEEREKRREEERKARRLLFKPCPFCGGTLAEIPYPNDITPFVQCPGCNATGPTSDQMDEEAIKRWNQRVPQNKETP